MAASIREILGVVKQTSLDAMEAGLFGRAKTSPPTGQRIFLEFRFRSGRRLPLDKVEDFPWRPCDSRRGQLRLAPVCS